LTLGRRGITVSQRQETLGLYAGWPFSAKKFQVYPKQRSRYE
jgi:hypothetical protein